MKPSTGNCFRWLLIAGVLLLPLAVTSTKAAERGPADMLEEVSEQLIGDLQQQQRTIDREPQRFFEVIEQHLGPHVDFPRISRWVLGKHWRKATPEQRDRFMEAFRDLLVRFYGAALLDDPEQLEQLLAQGDALITFQPPRVPEGEVDSTVRSEVHLPDGTVVPVSFRVHRRDGPWKVYDVTVEGISLVTSYRNSFSQTIAQRGIDGLIRQLEERERQATAALDTREPIRETARP